MVKLKGNANDAEMMKPANPSDQDNEMENDVDAVQKDIAASKKEIEELMDKEFEEQDKKIQKALDKEKELRQKIKDVKNDIQERTAAAEEGGISEQTEELLIQDLEELIKQQGEDIDFEFYYEGKLITPNQSIFEIIKDGERKRKQIEKVANKAE